VLGDDGATNGPPQPKTKEATMAQPRSIKFEYRNDNIHLRGLATARPEVAGDPPAVELFIRNERDAADEGDEHATLGFLVPGNGDSAKAFFDDLADSFANYPRSIQAMLVGWWHEPIETAGAVVLGPETATAERCAAVKAELDAPQPDGAA
jgi:hypothetical protein